MRGILKRIILIASAVFAVFAIVTAGFWIGAYNGAVTREAEVVEARGNVHTALQGRYDKVGTLIDAIESANATILGYLETITSARTAFATAIGNSNSAAADQAAQLVDGTFLTLVAYMEDNPDSYNTVSLYSGFMAEFSASTNLVTGTIMVYNEAVTAYNTHIQTFPNNIFVGRRAPYSSYELTNYSTSLPTFH